MKTTKHIKEREPMEKPTQLEKDEELKKELLALAKAGAPRPKGNTRLGRALKRFTSDSGFAPQFSDDFDIELIAKALRERFAKQRALEQSTTKPSIPATKGKEQKQ